jgi:hypothetical protein
LNGWIGAIEILGAAGLKVVLGTPTATPPRWMVDKHPDMLAVDAAGAPRKFGSRRHYCFSHLGYRRECARIVVYWRSAIGKTRMSRHGKPITNTDVMIPFCPIAMRRGRRFKRGCARNIPGMAMTAI